MKKALLAMTCVLASAGGVALALDPPHPVTSPGWIYGRNNCSPWATPPVTTKAACLACCQTAVDTWALPAHQLANCQAFCNSYWEWN